ncbi:MAG: hypothetical protein KAS93_08135 [Gammaproteobacteria bacterium]|nr:hypothetical protein [Gammaproteobacteria bacterium]
MPEDFGLEEDYNQYAEDPSSTAIETWDYAPPVEEDPWGVPGGDDDMFWTEPAAEDDFWAAEEEYYLDQPQEDFTPFWEDRDDAWDNQYDMMFDVGGALGEEGEEDSMWGGVKTAAGKVGDATMDFLKTPSGMGLAKSALGVLGQYLFSEDEKDIDFGPTPSRGGGSGKYVPRPGGAELTKSKLAEFKKR